MKNQAGLHARLLDYAYPHFIVQSQQRGVEAQRTPTAAEIGTASTRSSHALAMTPLIRLNSASDGTENTIPTKGVYNETACIMTTMRSPKF